MPCTCLCATRSQTRRDGNWTAAREAGDGFGDGPVLVEVGGDGSCRGGLDVRGRGEVREPLGEVDGADALRQVGQLLDGRRCGPPRRRRQPPFHLAAAW
jgi:hypothetical protein